MRIGRLSIGRDQRLRLDSEIVDLSRATDDVGREHLCALTIAGYHWRVRSTFGVMWAWREARPSF